MPVRWCEKKPLLYCHDANGTSFVPTHLPKSRFNADLPWYKSKKTATKQIQVYCSFAGYLEGRKRSSLLSNR